MRVRADLMVMPTHLVPERGDVDGVGPGLGVGVAGVVGVDAGALVRDDLVVLEHADREANLMGVGVWGVGSEVGVGVVRSQRARDPPQGTVVVTQVKGGVKMGSASLPEWLTLGSLDWRDQ